MSQEETDYAWLDEVLNLLVEDHIDIRGMDKESCNAWIDDYREAKTAIQAHFTTQTKPLNSIHMQDVNGIGCPACGHPTLMLMTGNYITCCMADCPNPDYTDALAKQHQVELLQARINEAEAAYDRMFNLGHRSSVYAQHEHLQILQAELNKLEDER